MARTSGQPGSRRMQKSGWLLPADTTLGRRLWPGHHHVHRLRRCAHRL